MSAEPDRPSDRSVERLATGVGEDVSDLRTRLHRALDEAGRLEAAGREDLAVSVLEEQRDVLLAVHQRLEARLADAAVEREAERVLQGAAPAPTAPGPASLTAVSVGEDGMALRLVASAVAAVLGIALLVSPEVGARGLTAAGSSAASDALQDSISAGAGDAAHEASASGPSAAGRDDAGGTTHAPDLRALSLPEADVLRAPAASRDEDADGGPTEAGELPLPDVEDAVDALTTVPDLPADPDDGAPTEPDTDGGTQDGGDGTAAPEGAGDTTEGSEPDSGTDEPSHDADAPDGDGTTSTDDGSSGGTDPADGGSGPGDGDTSGGGLQLGDASTGPTAVER